MAKTAIRRSSLDAVSDKLHRMHKSLREWRPKATLNLALDSSPESKTDSAPLLQREIKTQAVDRGENKSSLTSGFVDFASTPRAFQFCFVTILTYLAVSVIFFSFIFQKDWTVIDSLYFAVVTFTSVGYGDIVPDTNGGKIFTIFFVLFGAVIVGVTVGILGENLLQAHDDNIATLEKKGEF